MSTENKHRESSENDRELLERLKESARKYGYTPGALLLAAEGAAELQKIAVVPVFGPYPQRIDEAAIGEEGLANWPDWVAALVPPGSKWERLHWPDGSATVRLVEPRGNVLAATLVKKERGN